MDVIDEDKIHAKVIDPALNKLRDETIPALQGALKQTVTEALTQATETLHATVGDLSKLSADTIGSLRALVNGLNGTTVTIGPITIPEFTVTLKVPQV